MKKMILIVPLTIIVWGSTIMPLYGGPGKIIFKNKCVSCHHSHEAKIAVEPVDKASFQWQYFFNRHKHRQRYKVDLDIKLTKSELQLVEAYLVNHASDSDHPELIGKR